jgi:hypothetical protein
LFSASPSEETASSHFPALSYNLFESPFHRQQLQRCRKFTTRRKTPSPILRFSLARALSLSFLGSPETSLTYTFSRGSLKFDTGYEAGIISNELSLD